MTSPAQTRLEVCSVCRRVQAPRDACTSCGSTALVDLKGEGLAWVPTASHAPQRRSPKHIAGHAGAALAGAAASGALAWLTYFLLSRLTDDALAFGLIFTLVVLVGVPLAFFATYEAGRTAVDRYLWREPVPVAVELAESRSTEHLLLGGTETVVGTARRLVQTTVSPLAGKTCLAAAVEVVENGEVIARVQVAQEFVVLDDAGDPLVVHGELWLESLLYDLQQPGRKASLTVDGEQLLPSKRRHVVARELSINDGDVVEVRGHIGEELRPAMAAAYRDSDRVRVMFGEPGHPVLVSKRSG